ncbi:MAG: membrane protein insertase YidC [Thermoanaerobaculia bacterium]
MDNKRLLIAAVLSMAILFGWQLLFPPPTPAPRPVAPAATAVDGSSATTPAGEGATATNPEGGTVASQETTAGERTVEDAAPPVEATAESREMLESADLRATFSNRGGVLLSLEVRPPGKKDEWLELVAPRRSSPHPFSLVSPEGEPLPVNGALFAVERTDESGGERLRFRYRGPLGVAEKSYLLTKEGLIDFEVTANEGRPCALRVGPGLRAHAADEKATRFDHRLGVWSVGGKAETLNPAKAKELVEIPGAGLDWAGLEDTYFLTAFVPHESWSRVRFRPVLLEPTDDALTFDARPKPLPPAELSAADKALRTDVVLEIESPDGVLGGTSFWGSKQYDRLAAMPFGLERTVQLGMFGILTRPLLKGLQWIHANVVGNYGWAIVLMTTALKLLLLPLSLQAFKSMRKMQAINPKMQSIRERWKGKLRDKNGRFNPEAQRQMNEEIMGLYRAEGVNPAGGCFPMLIQLPIFFAFYSLLSSAVELWGSPWIGWIHDLTVADPYYVLPIAMGISQVVQQRMTPPPPDPMQRRLMQFLPIVFTVFSLGFPAGLVIYWLTNNLLTIGQQKMYNSFQNRANPVAVAAPARKGKKSK